MKATYIVDNEASYISLIFPYDPPIISKVKCFKGAYWNRTAHAWFIPYSDMTMKELKEAFPDLEPDDSFRFLSQGSSRSSSDKASPVKNTVVVTKTRIDKTRYLLLKPGVDEKLV